MRSKLKIGLALGGGGVRGFAHIGVLKVFEEAGIKPDLISGTSMGGIIGAIYAFNLNARLTEEIALNTIGGKDIFFKAKKPSDTQTTQRLAKILTFVKELYIWNLQAARKWLISSDAIEKVIRKIFSNERLEEAHIPFSAVATDLNSGEEIVLDKGEIVPALMASAAIPGVFPPVEWNGRLLVDGGIVSVVPVEPVRRKGADVVIGVNVEMGLEKREFRWGIDILFQTDAIRARELNRVKMEKANFIINPPVQNIAWAHFSKAKECIRRGEEAGRAVLAGIKEIIARKKRGKMLRSCWPFFKD